MRRSSWIGIVLLSMAAFGAAGAPASANHDPGGLFVRLIEVANTDTVIDVGAPGDSTGDLLTFHNKVKWDGGRLAGYDQGSCVRIDPAAGSWECTFTIELLSTGSWTGRVSVAGSFFDEGTSILAVTGGTGAFRHAAGTLRIRPLDATHYRFVLNIEG
jgi:hypothetical protein